MRDQLAAKPPGGQGSVRGEPVWLIYLEKGRSPEDERRLVRYLEGPDSPPAGWEAAIVVVTDGLALEDQLPFRDYRHPYRVVPCDRASSLGVLESHVRAGYKVTLYRQDFGSSVAHSVRIASPPLPLDQKGSIVPHTFSLHFERHRSKSFRRLDPHLNRPWDPMPRGASWCRIYEERQTDGAYDPGGKTLRIEQERGGRTSTSGALLHLGALNGRVMARAVDGLLRQRFELVEARTRLLVGGNTCSLTLCFPSWPIPSTISLFLPWR